MCMFKAKLLKPVDIFPIIRAAAKFSFEVLNLFEPQTHIKSFVCGKNKVCLKPLWTETIISSRALNFCMVALVVRGKLASATVSVVLCLQLSVSNNAVLCFCASVGNSENLSDGTLGEVPLGLKSWPSFPRLSVNFRYAHSVKTEIVIMKKKIIRPYPCFKKFICSLMAWTPLLKS